MPLLILSLNLYVVQSMVDSACGAVNGGQCVWCSQWWTVCVVQSIVDSAGNKTHDVRFLYSIKSVVVRETSTVNPAITSSTDRAMNTAGIPEQNNTIFTGATFA